MTRPTDPVDPPAAVTRCVLSEEQEAALRRVLGERVRLARQQLGVTQLELALAFGRTQPWVAEIESGRSFVQPAVLAALAAATGKSAGWFFGETAV